MKKHSFELLLCMTLIGFMHNYSPNATFAVVVVLPTPPFWFATAITLQLDIIKISFRFPPASSGYVKGVLPGLIDLYLQFIVN